MIKRLAPLRAVAWGAFVGVACTLATWMGTPSTGSAAHAVGELVGGGIGGGMPVRARRGDAQLVVWAVAYRPPRLIQITGAAQSSTTFSTSGVVGL